MVMGGGVGSRKTRAAAAGDDDARRPKRRSGTDTRGDTDEAVTVPAGAPTTVDAETALRHPPRPRKKKRR
jgi:hypothetical protein